MSTRSEQFLAASHSIGIRLCRDAIWAGDRCNWIGSSMEYVANNWQTVQKAFGPELYAGTAGIGLFLAELEAVAHEAIFPNAAQAAEPGWPGDTLAPANPPGQKHLCGFSHGTGGIGWAFLELERVTSERRFREAADHAFAYERHWYNPTYENWPDFRMANPGQPDAAPSYAAPWCHGAPGIGLSLH